MRVKEHLVEEPQPDILVTPLSDHRRKLLMPAAEIRHMQDPPYLWEGVLPEGALAALYGPPGVYKSFIALDLAFCVATGERCMGRPVRRGPVVYIAAEGGGGLRRRMAAWERAHGQTVTGVHFALEPINLLDSGAVSSLAAEMLELPEPPVLVIVDTLARSFGGGDENHTADMNRFVAAADRLRTTVGCAVVLVHHTPLKGGRLRGSSALLGALDVVVAVERQQATAVVLRCEKLKDGPEFDRIRLVPVKVEGDDGTSSLVLLPDESAYGAQRPGTAGEEAEPTWSVREVSMLDQLAGFGPEGASATLWQAAADEDLGIPKASFFRMIKSLVAEGKVAKFNASGKPRYRIPEAAASAPLMDELADGGDVGD